MGDFGLSCMANRLTAEKDASRVHGIIIIHIKSPSTFGVIPVIVWSGAGRRRIHQQKKK